MRVEPALFRVQPAITSLGLEDYGLRMSVIGHDYSMHNRSADGSLLPVRSVGELMAHCQGWTDHVNLFLEKTAAA